MPRRKRSAGFRTVLQLVVLGLATVILACDEQRRSNAVALAEEHLAYGASRDQIERFADDVLPYAWARFEPDNQRWVISSTEWDGAWGSETYLLVHVDDAGRLVDIDAKTIRPTACL